VIEPYLRPGDTFVDGGANVGKYTLPACALVGAAGRVIAIEPNPLAADLLAAALVPYPQARLVRAALTPSATGPTPLYWIDDTAQSSLFRTGLVAHPTVTAWVPSITLDLACGADRVDVIKLDLQGAEILALEGGPRVTRDARTLILEVWPEGWRAAGRTVADLRALLSPQGWQPIKPLTKLFRCGPQAETRRFQWADLEAMMTAWTGQSHCDFLFQR